MSVRLSAYRIQKSPAPPTKSRWAATVPAFPRGSVLDHQLHSRTAAAVFEKRPHLIRVVRDVEEHLVDPFPFE